MENNYLAEWQKEKQEKELKECNGNTTCEVKTRLYWGLIDVGQDASFASGVAVGIPENIVESVSGLLSMVTSPVETIMAFKELLARDDTISHIADMTKQSYLDKLDKMQAYYEKAGAEGSFKAGKEIGNIAADVATAFTGAGAVIKTGAGVGVKIISKAGKEIEIPNLTKNRTNIGTCSFRGDMEVKTDKGYQPISSIKVGDKVLAKNEITGITTYQKVQAHYSNPYDYTVYVEVKDGKGKFQTIVSNKIHPFFTQVLSGIAPASSEGHYYNGEIAKAQWIDAQYLQKGYRLLSANGEWQTVSNVNIKAEALKAYNMTVATDHTYFIRGAKADNEGVWVHNDCWDQLPFDAVATGKSTPDGRKLYTFKDGKGHQVTAYQGSDGRYYNPKVHSPESPTKINTKAVDSFPNRNGLRATKGHVYYTTPEATEAARKLGFEKTNQTLKGEAIYKDNKGRYITIDVGNGRNQGGAHNGGVWKMADSIKNLGKKETRMGTYDANLNRIGD
ncbi:hypothetical protein A1D25_09790 [Ursidibacter arcticus]|nr:hypothetical protein A1D25_09790 [Ursidibacter arcticus]